MSGLPVVRVAKKWTRYEACDTCPALASRPCLDMRTVVAGHHPARELAKPHKGRKRRDTT